MPPVRLASHPLARVFERDQPFAIRNFAQASVQEGCLSRGCPTRNNDVLVLPDGFAYVELFDGRDEWEFSESFAKPVQHDTGASERAGRRGAEFDESFVDYRAKGHRVQSEATSMVEGRSANVLRVTLRDGWVKDYYFDAESGLLVALRKAMPLHASGADVVSLTYFRDTGE